MLSQLSEAERLEAKARDLRASAESKRLGLEGERAFAEAVAPYGSRGWRILHDRKLPRSPANIDHLLVGPPGVVVADSKNYTGRLKVCEDGQVLVGGRPRGLEIDKVVGYARAVENATWQCYPATPVIPLICFIQDVGLTGPVMARGACLTQLDQLPSWLEDCAQVLSPREVWTLAEHLETAHPSRAAESPAPAPAHRRSVGSKPKSPKRTARKASAGTRRRPKRPALLFLFRLVVLLLMFAFIVGFLHVAAEKAAHHLAPHPTPTPAVTSPATSSRT